MREAGSTRYTVETNPQFLDFKKVEVTAKDETKLWKPAALVRVDGADGNVAENVDANAAAFTFRDAMGREMTVTIAAAGHIDSLHIKGEDEGSKFDSSSLEELFKEMAAKMPEGLAENPKVKNALSVEMGKRMGKEGFAGIEELIADGTLTTEQAAEGRAAKDEVIRLNRTGSTEKKSAFVASWKAEHPDSAIQFKIIRADAGGVIAPVVAAPKRETTKLFMVFGPNATGDKKTLYTIAPGRYMPPHPIPGQHANREGVVDEATFQESADAWFESVMLTEE